MKLKETNGGTNTDFAKTTRGVALVGGSRLAYSKSKPVFGGLRPAPILHLGGNYVSNWQRFLHLEG